MNKLFLIVISILPFCIGAQNINDVYNISTSYYQGTAKAMAMGNAIGAVGDDFSSIAINPAGLGLYRKSTFTFTPSILTSYTQSELRGSLATDSKAKLSVNNFGYVETSNDGSNIMSWAIGMNRTNNFNNSIYVDGFNDEHSLIDAYFAEMIANEIYNDAELEFYSPSYIYPLWQTWLIDFGDNGELYSPVPIGGLRQLKGVNSWGGTNEWTVSASINFNDKIYLGFSINLPYVYSKKITDYKEDFSTNTHENYWLQEETFSTTGWGVNGKLGIIAYPARWIRLGASFHTPTRYDLTDTWRTETEAHIDTQRLYETYIVPTSYFSYSMLTPWRANASVAFIFGNYGMITADYEYVDYRTIRLSAYDYDYRPYNQSIRNTFESTMNLRLGTEWRYQNYCFRAGYAFYGSPYGIIPSDGIYNYHNRNAFSAGIGYTKHLFTIDLAYVYTIQNQEYNLYSQYTSYYDALSPNVVYENFNLHSVVVSLKFKVY